MPDETQTPPVDFNKPIFGEGIKTNTPSSGGEDDGVDFNQPIFGEGVVTNAPSRSQAIERYVQPREDLGGLSPAEIDQGSVSKQYGRTGSDEWIAPRTLLGSPRLHDIYRRSEAIAIGDRWAAKPEDEKSGYEKQGIVGGAFDMLTGGALTATEKELDDARRIGVAEGITGYGAVKGFQEGAKAGFIRRGPAGALFGGIVGGALGAGMGWTATRTLQGEKTTPGEVAAHAVWGIIPSAVKQGVGAARGAAQFSAQSVAINEAALQTQSVLDHGEGLSLAPLEVAKRNLLAAGFSGVFGAVAGRKIQRAKLVAGDDISNALQTLDDRVAYWKKKTRSASTKGKRNKAKSMLSEARRDVHTFLNDPGMLTRDGLTGAAAHQQMRISQVIRTGLKGKVDDSGTSYESIRSLADTYRRFYPDDSPPQTFSEKLKAGVERFREGAITRFRPLDAAEEEIRRHHNLPKSKQTLGAKFEMNAGSAARAKLDVDDFDVAITDRIHNLAPKGRLGLRSRGAKEDARMDFNVYMFLRRTKQRLESGERLQVKIQERADELAKVKRVPKAERTPAENKYIKDVEAELRNLKKESFKEVQGYDMNRVNDELAILGEKLGKDRLAAIKDISEDFQIQADKALRLQVESGRMSEEVYQLIKAENDFYAPFAVRDAAPTIEHGVGRGGAFDTKANYTQAIRGIKDEKFKLLDITEEMRSMVWTSRILSDKNLRMRDFKKLADLDTDGTFIKRLKVGEKVKAKHEVVTVLDNGKAIEYQVSPEVARAIKNFNTPKALEWSLARQSSLPFKMGATALNVGFQIKNLALADMPRAMLISELGVKNPLEVVRFAGDYLHAIYSSASGQVGRGNKLYQQAMEAGVLRGSLQQMISPEATAKYGPLGQKYSIGRLVDDSTKIGNVIEESFKVLGVKRAMRMTGAKNVQDLLDNNPHLITEIRRYMGSPDFARFGKEMETANILFMFLNARTQGIASDVSRLGSLHKPEGRSAAVRMGLVVGTPTAYLAFYNMKHHKKDLEKVPAEDKKNHHIIFTGKLVKNEDGEELLDYIKIPKREAAKMAANLVEAGIHFLHERDPEAAAEIGKSILEELSPVNISGDTPDERLESVLSSVHPIIRGAYELSQPAGRSQFRHRPLMGPGMARAEPREQYTPRTPQFWVQAAQSIDDTMGDAAFEWMRSPIKLEHAMGAATAQLVTQFFPKKGMEGRNRIQNSWVGRFLGKSFMASGYIANDKEMKVLNKLSRKQATDQVVRGRMTEKFMKDRRGKKYGLVLREALEKWPLRNEDGSLNLDNGKMNDAVHQLILEEVRGLDSLESRVQQISPKYRAEYLYDKLKQMPEDQGAEKMRELIQKGLITQDTMLWMLQKGGEENE